VARHPRLKRTETFEELLANEARRFKEAAEKEQPGSMAQQLLLRRARQAETASHISEWISSPGLPAPESASRSRLTKVVPCVG
jgi:hypothetical protein